MAGWVYIISNESMPDILKIGYTERDPRKRAYELYNTGVPTAYKVDYFIYVSHPYEVEQKVHSILKSVNVGKEWFKSSKKEAISSIEDAIKISKNEIQDFFVDWTKEFSYEFYENEFITRKINIDLILDSIKRHLFYIHYRDIRMSKNYLVSYLNSLNTDEIDLLASYIAIIEYYYTIKIELIDGKLIDVNSSIKFESIDKDISDKLGRSIERIKGSILIDLEKSLVNINRLTLNRMAAMFLIVPAMTKISVIKNEIRKSLYDEFNNGLSIHPLRIKLHGYKEIENIENIRNIIIRHVEHRISCYLVKYDKNTIYHSKETLGDWFFILVNWENAFIQLKVL